MTFAPSEVETSFVSCLCECLRIEVRPCPPRGAALAIAPIPAGQTEDWILRFVARRLNIALHEISARQLLSLQSYLALAQTQTHEWILIQRLEGHSSKIWQSDRPANWTRLPIFSESLDILSKVFKVQVSSKTIPQLPQRLPKLWTVPGSGTISYSSFKNGSDKSQFAIAAQLEESPTEIKGFDIAHLLAVHSLMQPMAPQYYGCFRDVNLSRCNILFPDPTNVSVMIHRLLNQFKNVCESAPATEFLRSIIYLYSDFLAIHPFFNGNQRMAQALVSYALARRGFSIEWERATSAQLYYWARVSHNGHPSPMVQGVSALIRSDSIAVAARDARLPKEGLV